MGVSMKVLLAQLEPRVGDKNANIEKIEKAVGKTRPDLALFGELFLSGYMARDQWKTLAETIPGPATLAIAKIAKKHSTHVIFGMPERDARAKLLYNASVLVTPDGTVERYRKIHLATFGPFEEGVYFARGTEPKLVDTTLGKIGLIICFDVFLPELTRTLALQGADIIAVISAGPVTSRRYFEKVLPARAIENTVFVLYCNIVGTELNMIFSGGTQALGPRGETIAISKDYKEDLLTFDIDLADLKPARDARPTIRDAQPNLVERAWGMRRKAP